MSDTTTTVTEQTEQQIDQPIEESESEQLPPTFYVRPRIGMRVSISEQLHHSDGPGIILEFDRLSACVRFDADGEEAIVPWDDLYGVFDDEYDGPAEDDVAKATRPAVVETPDDWTLDRFAACGRIMLALMLKPTPVLRRAANGLADDEWPADQCISRVLTDAAWDPSDYDCAMDIVDRLDSRQELVDALIVAAKDLTLSELAQVLVFAQYKAGKRDEYNQTIEGAAEPAGAEA